MNVRWGKARCGALVSVKSFCIKAKLLSVIMEGLQVMHFSAMLGGSKNNGCHWKGRRVNHRLLGYIGPDY